MSDIQAVLDNPAVLFSVEQGVQVWWRPKVTVLAVPRFVGQLPLDVNWQGPAPDAERLTEFAGRLCYMSQSNPAEKSTRQYLEDILKQGHGSVLEHANISVLLEGVSRSLTHELVRHRAGWAYSQLSQRYVGSEHLSFVMPLLLLRPEYEFLRDQAISTFKYSHDSYSHTIRSLEEVESGFDTGISRRDRRKKIQQTARFLLPNATETKIVATANVRAWRTMLELRGAPPAEPEIRRIACRVFEELDKHGSSFFQDCAVMWNYDLFQDTGYGYYLDFTHHKV